MAFSTSITVAFSALYAAVIAIRDQTGIEWATADNDHTSAEIIFKVRGGKAYIVRLQELPDEDQDRDPSPCD